MRQVLIFLGLVVGLMSVCGFAMSTSAHAFTITATYSSPTNVIIDSPDWVSGVDTDMPVWRFAPGDTAYTDYTYMSSLPTSFDLSAHEGAWKFYANNSNCYPDIALCEADHDAYVTINYPESLVEEATTTPDGTAHVVVSGFYVFLATLFFVVWFFRKKS